MVNGDSFIFYPSFLEDLEKIKDEGIRVKVLLSILKYGCYNTPIDLSDIDPDGFLSVGINSIVRDIDSAKAKREEISKKRSEAGKRGGGQKGNQNARKKGHSEDDLDDDVDESDRPKRANPTKPTKRTFDSKTSLDVDVDVDVDIDKKDSYSTKVEHEEKKASKKDENEDINPPTRQNVDYKRVINLWHEVCVSYPRVTKLTDKRKKKIKARMQELSMDYEALRAIFVDFENSDYPKGQGWATFDFLFESEDNMVKTSEGKYKTKPKTKSFAEANKNVNAIWEERERKARERERLYHPNEYWKDVKFDPSDFS